MKATHAVWLPVLLLASTFAQTQSPPHEIVEIGPHHRVWQAVQFVPDAAGQLVESKSSFVELAVGLNFWSEKNMRWEESRESFSISRAGYAVAENGPYRLILAPNINEPGSVDLWTPDGKRFHSNPMGLSFRDLATGENILIAEVKDCVGEQVAPNVILFADAFDNVRAALKYTYSRERFEQDVILYENPPLPEGLSPETTVLEMYTEFFNPPEPVIKPIEKDDLLDDEDLEFGEMRIGEGIAYVLNEAAEPVSTFKTWARLDGERQFLIESVPYLSIEPLLQRVPWARLAPESPKSFGSREALVRGLAARKMASRPTQLAAIKPGRDITAPAVVLDYPLSLTGNLTNYVLRGDTTYYLSGTVNLYGTTVLQGGAVMKYTNNGAGSLVIKGPIECQTDPYRPAVFTSKDDNTVGETIPGSSGTPATLTSGTHLYLDQVTTPITLEHLRFAYGYYGFRSYRCGGASSTLRHAQLVRCYQPIYTEFTNAFYLQNVLIDGSTSYAIRGTSGRTINAEHLTAHRCGTFFNTGTLNLTNSLLVSITNWSTAFSGAFNATNSLSAVFQPVGAGHHYLASGSTNRNVGTTNVTSALLTALRKMTTYPPVVLSNTVVTSSVLSPQAARDTDLPDRGYHYAPIDWAVNTLTVTNGGTLVLTNGVVLGTFGDTGIWLRDGSQLVSEGIPAQRNGIVRFNTAQEQATNWGNGSLSGNVAVNPYNQGGLPSAQLRLTDFATLAGGGYHLYASEFGGYSMSNVVVRDCGFSGGSLVLGGPSASSLSLVNNLGERVALNLSGNGSVACYNNLFRGGFIELDRVTAVNPWTIRDNVFETPDTLFSWGQDPTLGCNAYINTTNRIYPTNSTDKVLGSFTYAVGPLGRYYQVTTNLLNQGSRAASDAGLYHHTTTTNQVKDTLTVDIGYHYVAVDAQGLPLDTDGDGLPDYLEDRNGNGSQNSGETDWQNPADLGLKVWITEPKKNSNLP
jgi:hypothetical protein